jgi:hypothetical protein
MRLNYILTICLDAVVDHFETLSGCCLNQCPNTAEIRSCVRSNTTDIMVTEKVLAALVIFT